MSNEQCIGCKSNYNELEHTICIYKQENNLHCPCYECLLKTMCNKACEDYMVLNISYHTTLSRERANNGQTE